MSSARASSSSSSPLLPSRSPIVHSRSDLRAHPVLISHKAHTTIEHCDRSTSYNGPCDSDHSSGLMVASGLSSVATMAFVTSLACIMSVIATHSVHSAMGDTASSTTPACQAKMNEFCNTGTVSHHASAPLELHICTRDHCCTTTNTPLLCVCRKHARRGLARSGFERPPFKPRHATLRLQRHPFLTPHHATLRTSPHNVKTTHARRLVHCL
jgi:hypothetical protein